jgi:putative Ca2+/H+ antiporter (TMEM165/GDT1 family)
MPAFSLIASSFAIVFVAELPDKTALASLVLATRFKARHVIAGAWLAFLVQTAVAVAAGSVLTLFPSQPVHLLAGFGFLVFAALAFRRNEEAELRDEQEEIKHYSDRWPPWLTSFAVVFAAEWGDLTQLATAALVARTGQPAAVAIGAIAALWCVTVIAVVIGTRLAKILSPVILARLSGALFAAIGVVIILAAVW